MINVDDQPDLDSVLDSLTMNSKQTIKEIKDPPKDLTEEEAYTFIINKLVKTISDNEAVIEQTTDLVGQVGTADYVEAHASIVKSQSELLKNMVGIIMEKKKLDQAKTLKTRELDIKEKAASQKLPELTNGSGGTTNNIIVATRDNIFDSLFGSDADKEKAKQKLKELNNITIDV